MTAGLAQGLALLVVRQRATWLVSLLLAAACSKAGVPDSDVLLTVDSAGAPTLADLGDLVLHDPAGSPLGGYTTFIALGEMGDVYVGDMSSQRVVVFNTNGIVVRTVGSQGEGPGEFELPGTIGIDPLGRLFVNDVMQRKVSVFAAGSDSVISEMPVAFAQLGIGSAQVGDTLVFALQQGTIPLARWDMAANTMIPFGAELVFEIGALSVQMSYGFPGIASNPDGFVVWRPASAGLEHYSSDGRLLETLRVPAARRKGEPPGLVPAQRLMWREHPDSMIGSAAVGIHRLPQSGYVLASLDMSGEVLPNGKVRRGQYRLFLSVVSDDLERACVDARVPLTSDVLPVPTFRGDSVYVLVREVKPSNAVVTTIKRFRISAASCQWHPTVPLRTVMQ